MLCLEFVKIAVLYIANIKNSLFSSIYISIGVLLLISLYIKIILLVNSLQGLLLSLVFID